MDERNLYEARDTYQRRRTSIGDVVKLTMLLGLYSPEDLPSSEEEIPQR